MVLVVKFSCSCDQIDDQLLRIERGMGAFSLSLFGSGIWPKIFKNTFLFNAFLFKIHLRNHIESVHFPGHFSYNCNHCEKTYKTKNALCIHVSRVHGDKK